MKKFLSLFLILPLIAYGDVRRGDFSTKTTTLAVQASACTTAGDTDCTVFGLCTAATSGGMCSAAAANWFIGEYSNFTLTLRNSGANALTETLVEVSDNGSNWEVWNSTTFAALASGAVLSLAVSGNSRKYIRVEGRSASGTDVVASLAANDG